MKAYIYNLVIIFALTILPTNAKNNTPLLIDQTGDKFLGLDNDSFLADKDQLMPGFYSLYSGQGPVSGAGHVQDWDPEGAQALVQSMKKLSHSVALPDGKRSKAHNIVWGTAISIITLGLLTSGLGMASQVSQGKQGLLEGITQWVLKMSVCVLGLSFFIGGLPRAILGTIDSITGVDGDQVNNHTNSDFQIYNNQPEFMYTRLAFAQFETKMYPVLEATIEAFENISEKDYYLAWGDVQEEATANTSPPQSTTEENAPAEIVNDGKHPEGAKIKNYAISIINDMALSMPREFSLLAFYLQNAKSGNTTILPDTMMTDTKRFFDLVQQEGVSGIIATNEINIAGIGNEINNNSTPKKQNYLDTVEKIGNEYLGLYRQRLINHIYVITKSGPISNSSFADQKNVTIPIKDLPGKINGLSEQQIRDMFGYEKNPYAKGNSIALDQKKIDDINRNQLFKIIPQIETLQHTIDFSDVHKVNDTSKIALQAAGALTAIPIWTLPLAALVWLSLYSLPKSWGIPNHSSKMLVLAGGSVLTSIIIAVAVSALNNEVAGKTLELNLGSTISSTFQKGWARTYQKVLGTSGTTQILSIFIISAPAIAAGIVNGTNHMAGMAGNLLNQTATTGSGAKGWGKLKDFGGKAQGNGASVASNLATGLSNPGGIGSTLGRSLGNLFTR